MSVTLALQLIVGCDAGAPLKDRLDSGVPGWSCYTDGDGDGFGSGTPVILLNPCPRGTVERGGDCQDSAATISPAATEICDGVDNDCDGLVDTDAVDRSRFYADDDGDGFGGGQGGMACTGPPGAVTRGGDCEDGDAAIYPGAPELCNGQDQDCDARVDEEPVDGSAYFPDQDGDGYGDPSSGQPACEAPGGSVENDLDCDDTDAGVHPDAPERDCLDPRDYNCDGSVGYADADGDGFPACEDCDDQSTARNPEAVEWCNGLDDDCDGQIDPDGARGGDLYYLDADGDGYGDSFTTHVACTLPPGYADRGLDCDDQDQTIHPDAPEVCGDGLDNDCDTTASGCGVWGTMDLATDADVLLLAEAYADGTGCQIEAAGDVDQDGLPDLLVGSARSDRGGVDSGAAYVVAGGDVGVLDLSQSMAILEGESADDRAGIVASAGDVNGDGVPDVMVGSSIGAAYGSNGVAYVLFGPVSGVRSLATADLKFVGETYADHAGIGITGLDDRNGDGLAELLISAPRYDGPGLENSGAVYLLMSPFSGTTSLADADVRLLGEYDHGLVGWAVERLGDLDGDGLDEFGAGAPLADANGEDSGAIYVASDPPTGDYPIRWVSVEIAGEQTSDSACWHGAAGDVDQDGYGDLLVAASDESTAFNLAGAVYLLHGPILAGASLAGAEAKFTGTGDYQLAGQSLGGDGDVDGDGWLDILIGGPADNQYTSPAGRVWLVRGPFSTGVFSLNDADATLNGQSPGDWAGYDAEILPDMNGDGFDEVIVGAPFSASAPGGGAAYVLFGGVP